jgi:pyruvate formate lyase activating enzyme
MEFRGWQKTSLLEYPGKISTVLFTGGCNFRCPFCYNSDLVLRPEKLKRISEGDVLDFLKRRRKLYQAVMVTGGEPTVHRDLPEFFKKVKSLGLMAGLETNGTNPGMLKALIRDKLIDFVAMDVKTSLKREKYMKAAAISDGRLFGNVLKSVEMLKDSGMDYEFRTTVVPGMHTEGDILEIADQLKGSKKYVLQKFIPRETTLDPEFAKVPPYPDAFFTGLKDKIGGKFGEFEIRNVNE